jgi:hypothetical protein
MRRMNWMSFALLLFTGHALQAETTLQEFAGVWFINPLTQNWTCSIALGRPPGPADCREVAVSSLAFVAAEPIAATVLENGQLVNKYVVYAGEWGGVQGPGSECPGDSVMLFLSPYTADGAKGVGLVYRGVVQPSCGTLPSGSNWALHSVFRDNARGGIQVTAGRTDLYCQAVGCFEELWLGSGTRSGGADVPHDLRWSLLVRSGLANVDLINLHLTKVAANDWRGLMTYHNLNPAPWQEATPVKINWSANTFSYKTGPSTWTSISIGGSITAMPWSMFQSEIHSFDFVSNRYEVWLEGTPTAQFPARSGNRPNTCPDDPYLTNMSNMDTDQNGQLEPRWTLGQAQSYAVLDVDFNLIKPLATMQSTVHPVPADFSFSLGNIARVDNPHLGRAVYYASQDYGICQHKYLNDWGHWSGSGIRVGRLQDVP